MSKPPWNYKTWLTSEILEPFNLMFHRRFRSPSIHRSLARRGWCQVPLLSRHAPPAPKRARGCPGGAECASELGKFMELTPKNVAIFLCGSACLSIWLLIQLCLAWVAMCHHTCRLFCGAFLRQSKNLLFAFGHLDSTIISLKKLAILLFLESFKSTLCAQRLWFM